MTTNNFKESKFKIIPPFPNEIRIEEYEEFMEEIWAYFCYSNPVSIQFQHEINDLKEYPFVHVIHSAIYNNLKYQGTLMIVLAHNKEWAICRIPNIAPELEDEVIHVYRCEDLIPVKLNAGCEGYSPVY